MRFLGLYLALLGSGSEVLYMCPSLMYACAKWPHRRFSHSRSINRTSRMASECDGQACNLHSRKHSRGYIAIHRRQAVEKKHKHTFTDKTCYAVSPGQKYTHTCHRRAHGKPWRISHGELKVFSLTKCCATSCTGIVNNHEPGISLAVPPAFLI